ncbi:MAG TPA: S8 family serine peptidase [Blastocatellia bacterium]|nr:S8 family serine peptidase [Blastocatellia bacterium]
MKKSLFRATLILSLFVALTAAGATRTHSEQGRNRIEGSLDREGASQYRSRVRATSPPLSYRSPGSMRKLMVASGEGWVEAKILATGQARRLRKYGAYTLIEASDSALASLDSAALERAIVRDDMNLILLRRGQIDTTGPEPQVSSDLKQPRSLSRSLHLVQLTGPPTPSMVDALKSSGAKIVSYIPNNAYLVWASTGELARIRALDGQTGIIQWEAPFHPAYKLDPRLRLEGREPLSVSIEMVDSPEADRAVAEIEAIAQQTLMPALRAAGTVHLKVRIEPSRLKDVARAASVISIEPWARIRLSDERANQIVAGAVTEESVNNIVVNRPSHPGFLPFLNSLGFNSNFDFAVDVADTGFDIGSEDFRLMHQDFLDQSGNSRIAYLFDFSRDSDFHPDDLRTLPVHDALGHGTINASIIGGFNINSGSAFADSLGFQYGLGIAPFARVGISKIFNDRSEFGFGVSFTSYISAAYRNGARISNNSWGSCDLFTGFCNIYSGDARIFDSLVRDADPDQPGNQGMVIVFAAGNDGQSEPQSIGNQATAKNVIAVGASENFRATGPDGESLRDGCGVPASGADNALDIIVFSSGGPVQDGRYKPDLVAPGTHMTGAVPQDPFYSAKPEIELGVCDRYFPSGQTRYTWSSGTSHSAPMVSGAAALAYQWLRTKHGFDPSPALVKAFILNSTRYVAGRFGGDSLPGARQGWGLLSLSRMFEQSERIIYDQSDSRTFNQSGGAPFEITGVVSDPSKEFRVMLSWNDPPGSPNSNAPYINQLNLEVIVGGVLYNGNHFNGQYSTPGGQKDFLNNTQGVRLPAGVTGPFVVRVWPTIIAGDGVPGNSNDLDQDFALVITNGREMPVPLLTVVKGDSTSQGINVSHTDGSMDPFLIPGENASISVTLFNESQTAEALISSATLALATGERAASTYPVIGAGHSAANETGFAIRVPSNLRCGSVAEFLLTLSTPFGDIKLPVRVQVGRPASEQVLLDDDVDSRRVKWKAKKGFNLNSITGNSGTSSYHTVDPGKEENDFRLSTLTMKKKIAIPENAGRVRLSFFHIFNFEPGFDGGVLEISTDGGSTWQDLGSRVIVGGYDGQLTEASENPLGSRQAWTSRGRAGVFSQVVVNLDDFAGQQIRLRFLAGFDFATGILEGYTGWFIDDIRISSVNFNCR